MKRQIIIIILFFSLASCATVKVTERKEYQTDQRLAEPNVKLLNGTFHNNLSSRHSSLWKTLFPNEKPIKDWEQAKVNFETVSL